MLVKRFLQSASTARTKRFQRCSTGNKFHCGTHSLVATTDEWAWAAAIFEGFGAATTLNDGRDLRLALHTTERDLAERYAAIVGVRLLGPYVEPPTESGAIRRPSFRCNLNGRRAVDALGEMWEWLGNRTRARVTELGFAPSGRSVP